MLVDYFLIGIIIFGGGGDLPAFKSLRPHVKRDNLKNTTSHRTVGDLSYFKML